MGTLWALLWNESIREKVGRWPEIPGKGGAGEKTRGGAFGLHFLFGPSIPSLLGFWAAYQTLLASRVSSEKLGSGEGTEEKRLNQRTRGEGLFRGFFFFCLEVWPLA